MRLSHFILAAASSLTFVASCNNDKNNDNKILEGPGVVEFQSAQTLLENLPPQIQQALPAENSSYDFSSQFNDESSVSYDGQVFRQVLIEDLKKYIGGLKRSAYPSLPSDLETALLSYYAYDSDLNSQASGVINGFSAIQLTPKDLEEVVKPIAEGTNYDDLQLNGKQLRDKTAGNDNELKHGSLKGWSLDQIGPYKLSEINADQKDDTFIEPEDLLTAWLRLVAYHGVEGEAFSVARGDAPAELIDAAYLTEEGWDLNQLIEKFLHGAVSFSQAARDYLSTDLGEDKGLNAGNDTTADSGVSYTALEHHWDEGFGYFGAARDYLSYEDRAIASNLSRDRNEDGSISLRQERNFGISVGAAKRDLGANGTTDFTKDLMVAMLRGRALISTQPEGYMEYVKAYATVALITWEKVIAATVIHYINDTLEVMEKFGTEEYSFATHAKVWSEMKGYALAFQFNPKSLMPISNFEVIHTLIGDKPVLYDAGTAAHETYKQQLLQVRDYLKTVYSFSDEQASNW